MVKGRVSFVGTVSYGPLHVCSQTWYCDQCDDQICPQGGGGDCTLTCNDWTLMY